MLSPKEIDTFRGVVADHYRDSGRHDLPWRQAEPDGHFDAYKILVSEVMLQQTQVSRVIPKYQAFVARFPTSGSLADAPLGAVLRAWSGLGYNRRAKYLHQAAQHLQQRHDGIVPRHVADLVALPGIGHNTAGAILAYAYDLPVPFIETNIRTVFIHHFFANQQSVTDRAILELVTATLPAAAPRQWYWGLMDYGSYLKQTVGSTNPASASYTKQTTFAGSRRQLRGRIIRELGKRRLTHDALRAALDDERTADVVGELLAEGLIRRRGGYLGL